MLFNSNSVNDTYQFAKRLTQNISKGNIIALIGDLGTGKTTFTQGVAEALGIKENVGSPTFKLVSEIQRRGQLAISYRCLQIKRLK